MFGISRVLFVCYYQLATWLAIAHAVTRYYLVFGILRCSPTIALNNKNTQAFINYVSKFAPSTIVIEFFVTKTTL